MVANVNIWGTFVGAVLWDEDKKIGIFEFSKDFINKGLNIAPLTMPLEALQRGNRIFSFPMLPFETYKGLPGVLADSLPDRYGNLLIDSWLKSQNRQLESVSPVEKLCYIGNRGMGSLEYEPSIFSKSENTSPVEIKEIVEIVNQVLNNKTKLDGNLSKNDAPDTITKILEISTSAGGARAKAVIAYNNSTGEIRSGQLKAPNGFEHWMIKLDGVAGSQLGKTNGFGRIEYSYYEMARDCGIIMNQCQLKEENDRAHFMTKRFDRIGNEKIHMQSLCAIAHLDYNDPNSYSYEQAFQTMRELRLPYSAAEQMFRRMTFNVIAKNHDYHTKNISFLMDKNGQWHLSPAYDLVYAYDKQNRWLHRHQLSINGKRDNISSDDLLRVAKNINIKNPIAIIEQTKDIVSQWTKYAKNNNVNPAFMAEINKNLEQSLKYITTGQKDIKLKVPNITTKKDKGLSM